MRHTLLSVGFACLILATGIGVGNGCSAAQGTASNGGLGGGFGGSANSNSTTGSTGGDTGQGGGLHIPDGGKDTGGDVAENPCGTDCGPTELCDEAHLGLDDNCDGNVDEGCPCTPGQAHFCFKGDAAYLNYAGCYPGTEKCTENGTWGPCVGGVHATPDQKCYLNDLAACHAIQSPPFATVDLKAGTGTFSANADPGSETWTVACPTGVSPCPAVGPTPPDAFTPLQSGEYTVTYDKKVMGTPGHCTYPLIVGAPGLRVELTWEHPSAGGADLDLHVHKPMDPGPWATDGSGVDCGYENCTINSYGQFSTGPEWFAPPPAMPPTPVNWYLDPTLANNTCYYDPRGVGMRWSMLGKGCHNPRLDSDNVGCNPGLTDQNLPKYCTPENINIDFPPSAQWTRVGVYYYDTHNEVTDLHPDVKIFCNGSLAAELGSTVDPMTMMIQPAGYSASVVFQPSDGAPADGDTNAFWEVGDVLFYDLSQQTGPCSKPAQCVVQPLYADQTAKTPLVVTGGDANGSIGPAYPPIPTMP